MPTPTTPPSTPPQNSFWQQWDDAASGFEAWLPEEARPALADANSLSNESPALTRVIERMHATFDPGPQRKPAKGPPCTPPCRRNCKCKR